MSRESTCLGRFSFVRNDRPTKSKVTIQQISQILNIMHKGRWFISKTSSKKPISLPKCLVRLWSSRPVLTFGKRAKGALQKSELTLFIENKPFQNSKILILDNPQIRFFPMPMVSVKIETFFIISFWAKGV